VRDPSTTFDQLKSLRLVCRGFNHVAAPRVLSCVRLFGNGDNPVSNIRQLHAIVSSNLNGHLYATNTLVLGWKWKYEHLTVFKSFRTMRNSDKWVRGMIWNSTLAPLAYLLVILFVPCFLPLNICDLVVRLHARYRLPRALVLCMSNVKRVMCVCQYRDCGYELTTRQMGIQREQWSGSDGVRLSKTSPKVSSVV